MKRFEPSISSNDLEIPPASRRGLSAGKPGLIVAAWAMLALFAGWGCQLGIPQIDSAAPTSSARQQEEILKTVPYGTLRSEVVEKLKATGMRLSPGASDSVYYCDTWKREDGTQWLMDVVLLFDESDEFYAMRPGDAEAGLVTDSPAESGDKNSPRAQRVREASPRRRARPSDDTKSQ